MRQTIPSHLSLLLLLLTSSTPTVVGEDEPNPTVRFRKTDRVVLDAGPKGSFDSCQAKYPSILKVGDEFQMWYNGRTDDCFTGSIGLATSHDGLTWTNSSEGRPVFRHGPPGTFDSTKVDHPAVLRFDGRFHMWYTAGDKSSRYTIGYATSSDGRNWSRENDGKPVLTAGAPGRFDDKVVLHPAVVRDDSGLLHLWYNGVGVQPTFRVGHAVSRDGLHWERKNGGDPVLVPSRVGEFEENYVYNVHVRLDAGLFRMWYSAAKRDFGSGGHNCLTYATSSDGTHWKKDVTPTLISGPNGSIDQYAAFACYTVRRDDGLWMYYSVADKNQTYRVSLAREIR